MRDKTLIIGNWKMNLTVGEASLYVHKLNEQVQARRNVEISLAPTMLCLQPLSLQIDRRKFSLSAQNLYWRDEGAYTGEVSARQLNGLVKYAIIGHSERRHVFHEHDRDVRAKVQAAVRNRITPVLCIGETAAERAQGETMAMLHDQIVGGLANLTAEEVAEMVIAYEPVWAISGGKDFSSHATPTAGDIGGVIKGIRRQIEHLFGKQAAKSVRVLYGGSTNGANAGEFLSVSDLDGLLIGGASLSVKEFTTIAELAHERKK